MAEQTYVDADPDYSATTVSRELQNNKDVRLVSKSIMSIDEYSFLSMTYYGDKYYRSGVLIRPHEREDNLSYTARREMAFLKNFLKPVVNSRIDPVFSAKIVRETKDESGEQIEPILFKPFLSDCDNCGNDLGAFVEQAAREGNLQSLTFIVVDNYRAEQISTSAEENAKNRILPYVYRQNRNTMHDYSVDGYGKIEWIRFFDHCEKDPNGKDKFYYRYWDSVESKMQLMEKKGSKIKWTDTEVITHNLGVVPVYPMAFISPRTKDTLDIDYEFYDLARCNWTIYNLDSATMEAIFDQCFSLLCIQGTKEDDVSVGTKSICWVEPGVSNMPQFASPSPEVAKLASEYADKIKAEIYEIAEQNGVTAKRTAGASEQSGKAKEWDFQAHGFILKKIAGICYKTEIWIADIFKRYTGEVFEYVPRYKYDYSIVNSDGLIAVQEAILTNDFGPKGVSLAKKNIARIAFIHNEEAEVTAVLKEIDSMTEDETISENEINDTDESVEANT